jgi:hypothetical protein
MALGTMDGAVRDKNGPKAEIYLQRFVRYVFKISTYMVAVQSFSLRLLVYVVILTARIHILLWSYGGMIPFELFWPSVLESVSLGRRWWQSGTSARGYRIVSSILPGDTTFIE